MIHVSVKLTGGETKEMDWTQEKYFSENIRLFLSTSSILRGIASVLKTVYIWQSYITLCKTIHLGYYLKKRSAAAWTRLL